MLPCLSSKVHGQLFFSNYKIIVKLTENHESYKELKNNDPLRELVESITPVPYLCISNIRVSQEEGIGFAGLLGNNPPKPNSDSTSPHQWDANVMEIVTKDVRRIKLFFKSTDNIKLATTRLREKAFFGATKLHTDSFAPKHHPKVSASADSLPPPRTMSPIQAQTIRTRNSLPHNETEAACSAAMPSPPSTSLSSPLTTSPSSPASPSSNFVYSPIQEYHRLSNRPYWDRFCLKDQGPHYESFPTYPRYVFFPSSVDEPTIKECASYRSSQRLPAVVWIHPTNGATLSRCSQPRTGFRNFNEADQRLVKSIWSANPNYFDPVPNETPEESRKHPLMLIQDARSRAAAAYNMVVGGGYEDALLYGRCKIEFASIGNIHAVRDAFNALSALCSEEKRTEEADVWATQWHAHIQTILVASLAMIDALESGASVLTHCTDGWDRTSQLSAMVQLLMDPFFRTASGFCQLIQKEWLSFGHKFCERLSFGEAIPSASSQASPVFLQWIDAVAQVISQFPKSFEFTEQFLIKIVDIVHSGQFGNFLANCEAVYQDKFAKTTASCWPQLEQEWVDAYDPTSSPGRGNNRYRNTSYEPSDQTIRIKTELKSLIVWSSFYHRFNSRYSESLKQKRVDRFPQCQSQLVTDLVDELSEAKAETEMWKAAFRAAAEDDQDGEIRSGLVQLYEYMESGPSQFDVHIKFDNQKVKAIYLEAPYRIYKSVNNLSTVTLDVYAPKPNSSHPPTNTNPLTGSQGPGEVVLTASVVRAGIHRTVSSHIVSSSYQQVINVVANVASTWGKYLWESATAVVTRGWAVASPPPVSPPQSNSTSTSSIATSNSSSSSPPPTPPPTETSLPSSTELQINETTATSSESSMYPTLNDTTPPTCLPAPSIDEVTHTTLHSDLLDTRLGEAASLSNESVS